MTTLSHQHLLITVLVIPHVIPAIPKPMFQLHAPMLLPTRHTERSSSAVKTSGQPITDFGIVLSDSSGNWINEVTLSTLNITQTLPGGWVLISLPVSQLDPANTPIGTVDLENA